MNQASFFSGTSGLKIWSNESLSGLCCSCQPSSGRHAARFVIRQTRRLSSVWVSTESVFL